MRKDEGRGGRDETFFSSSKEDMLRIDFKIRYAQHPRAQLYKSY